MGFARCKRCSSGPTCAAASSKAQCVPGIRASARGPSTRLLVLLLLLLLFFLVVLLLTPLTFSRAVALCSGSPTVSTAVAVNLAKPIRCVGGAHRALLLPNMDSGHPKVNPDTDAPLLLLSLLLCRPIPLPRCREPNRADGRGSGKIGERRHKQMLHAWRLHRLRQPCPACPDRSNDHCCKLLGCVHN